MLSRPTPDIPQATTVAHAGSAPAATDPNGVLWIDGFGSPSDDKGNGIGVDSTGASYTVGTMNKEGMSIQTTSGITNLTSVGKTDVFLLKADASGNVLWAKSWGSFGDDVGSAIAVDLVSGTSYITGGFGDTTLNNGTMQIVTFNGTTTLTPIGKQDIFVLKVDSSGSVLWARNFGSNATDVGKAIVLDAAGGSYITGNFGGTGETERTMTIDTLTGPVVLTVVGPVPSNFDTYVIKLNTMGQAIWATSYGSTIGNGDGGFGTAVNAAGDASYILGQFGSSSVDGGTVTVVTTSGTTVLSSNGRQDFFVIRMNNVGQAVWARSWGTPTGDRGNALALDPTDGNLVVTGMYQSSGTVGMLIPMADGPNANLTSLGNYDIFIGTLGRDRLGVKAKEGVVEQGKRLEAFLSLYMQVLHAQLPLSLTFTLHPPLSFSFSLLHHPGSLLIRLRS